MTGKDMMSWVIVGYVITSLTRVGAFYNGAPHQSCQSFDPVHGTQGPNPVPYSIQVTSTNTYTNKQKIDREYFFVYYQHKCPCSNGSVLDHRSLLPVFCICRLLHLRFIIFWMSLGPFSLPCATKWPLNINQLW